MEDVLSIKILKYKNSEFGCRINNIGTAVRNAVCHVILFLTTLSPASIQPSIPPARETTS